MIPVGFDVEVEFDVEGETWSAAMPDALGLPREYQGLTAVGYSDPAAALRGLAELLESQARHDLGETLARLQSSRAVSHPAAGRRVVRDAPQA